jgi:hypothetical protein
MVDGSEGWRLDGTVSIKKKARGTSVWYYGV